MVAAPQGRPDRLRRVSPWGGPAAKPALHSLTTSGRCPLRQRQAASSSARQSGLLVNFVISKTRGFTLIELLVVISLMAIATAGISLAIRDGGEQQLEREAERLATLLESARAKARTNGARITWQPLASGFRFEGLPPGINMPGQWLQPGVQVQSATPLVLGPEPLIPPQAVTIFLPQTSTPPIRIATDGMRPFSVQNLP